MKINVHIERLILDGLPIARQQGPVIQEALETELKRLLVAEGELNFASGAMPRVAAPGIELMDNNPVRLGEQVARAVHGGITQ